MEVMSRVWPRGQNLRNSRLINVSVGAIVCLVSAASRHRTGQVIFLDAGASIA